MESRGRENKKPNKTKVNVDEREKPKLRKKMKKKEEYSPIIIIK